MVWEVSDVNPYKEGKGDMAIAAEALRKELEERLAGQSEPSWSELVEVCQSIGKRAGITPEETDEIVRRVRLEIYDRRSR